MSQVQIKAFFPVLSGGLFVIYWQDLEIIGKQTIYTTLERVTHPPLQANLSKYMQR